MNYRLNDMVFLVDGKVRSCIYDLNNGNLYSIGSSESNLIKDILSKPQHPNIVNESKLLRTLLELGLLVNGVQDFSVLSKISIDNPKLEFAWLEITKKCNCRCIHCYNSSESEKLAKDMSMDDFVYAVDELEKYGVKKVQLIGGEPLVTSKFFEMVDYIYKKFEVSVFTNSNCFNDDKIKFLKERNIKTICSTLFSYSPEEHDKVTQIKGSHNATVSNLKRLKENGFDVEVFNVRIGGIDLGTKNTDLFDLSKKVDYVRCCGKGNLSLYTPELLKERLHTKKNFSYKLNSKRVLKAMNYHHCYANKIYVDVNLDLYPCAMERKIKYGNLRDDKLNILHNPKIYMTTKDDVDECKDCEYRYACPDCRTDGIDDNFYGKPWFCTYNPLQGTWEDVDEFIRKLGF